MQNQARDEIEIGILESGSPPLSNDAISVSVRCIV